MKKLFKVIECFDCRVGKTLIDAANELGLSTRHTRRYLTKIEDEFPSFDVERIYDAGNETRYRIVGRSDIRCYVTSRDLLKLHELLFWVKTARAEGREDGAEKLLGLYELIMRSFPAVARITMEKELGLLDKAERRPESAHAKTVPGAGSARRAVLDRLRLAVVKSRVCRIVAAGAVLTGSVVALHWGSQPVVDLRTPEGEDVSVFVAAIEAVYGVDDLIL
jgi:hypothetical protein